jgi:hypothetical protein
VRTYAGIAGDSSGAVLNIAGPGVGVVLEPAAAVTPGAFPVTVTLYPSGDSFQVTSPRALYFREPFRELRISGGPVSGEWNVYVLQERGEALEAGTGRARKCVRVQAATVIGTANPASASDGFAVHPAYRSWQFYFTGASQAVEIWTRSVGGVWQLAETIAAGSIPGVVGRYVAFGGGRLAFRCAAGGTSAEVDAEVETG